MGLSGLRTAIRQGLVRVTIIGSASDVGTAGNNMLLARQRADTVRVALQGFPSGSGTSGGLLGSEQVKFQMFAFGANDPAPLADFPNIANIDNSSPLKVGKYAIVIIDQDESNAGMRQVLSQAPAAALTIQRTPS
jgi:hypothetical protein